MVERQPSKLNVASSNLVSRSNKINNKFDFYPKDDDIIIFHVYWHGDISRKQLLCINSYLKTQNLEKTKLWVWLDYKTFSNKNVNIIVHV